VVTVGVCAPEERKGIAEMDDQLLTSDVAPVGAAEDVVPETVGFRPFPFGLEGPLLPAGEEWFAVDWQPDPSVDHPCTNPAP
jgi:hypothetical protein